MAMSISTTAGRCAAIAASASRPSLASSTVRRPPAAHRAGPEAGAHERVIVGEQHRVRHDATAGWRLPARRRRRRRRNAQADRRPSAGRRVDVQAAAGEAARSRMLTRPRCCPRLDARGRAGSKPRPSSISAYDQFAIARDGRVQRQPRSPAEWRRALASASWTTRKTASSVDGGSRGSGRSRRASRRRPIHRRARRSAPAAPGRDRPRRAAAAAGRARRRGRRAAAPRRSRRSRRLRQLPWSGRSRDSCSFIRRAVRRWPKSSCSSRASRPPLVLLGLARRGRRAPARRGLRRARVRAAHRSAPRLDSR